MIVLYCCHCNETVVLTGALSTTARIEPIQETYDSINGAPLAHARQDADVSGIIDHRPKIQPMRIITIFLIISIIINK